MKGKCKWFHNRKSYGFITGENGEDFFVSYAGIISPLQYKTLNEDEEVTFEPMEQDKAKFKYDKAVQVKSTYVSTQEVGDDDTNN